MKKSLISCIVIVAMLLTYCVPKNADVLDNSNKEKESIAKPEKLSAETPKAQGATENSGGKDTPPTEGEGEKRSDTPPAPENEEEGKDKEAAEKELQPSTTTPDAPANKENSEQIAPPVETPAKENPLLPASGEEKKESKQENPAPTEPKQEPTTSLRLEEEQPATSPKPKEEARKEQPTTPPAQKENTKKEKTKEKQPATPSSPKEESTPPTPPVTQEKPKQENPAPTKPKQEPTTSLKLEEEQPATSPKPKEEARKEQPTTPPTQKENTKKEETKEKQPATPSSPKEEPKQPTLLKQEKPEEKQPVTPKQEEPKQQPTPPAATQKEQPKTEQQPVPTAPKQPEQKEKETPTPSLKEEPSKPAEKPQTTPKQPEPETKPTEKPTTTTTPSAPKPTEPTTTAPTLPPATTPVSGGTGTQQGVGGTSTPPTEQPAKVNPIDEKYRNKTVWVRGVNAPAYDEKSAYKLKHPFDKSEKPGWIYQHDDYKWPDGSIINYQMLPWQPEYGYFDVKKTYKKVPGASDDAYMCWAASASNIVYWWLYHNRKYIEAYDKKYGNTDGSKKYTRPSSHFEYPMKTYPVMEEFFKKCFSNQGGQSTGAVEYFISARRRDLPSAPRYEGFKGFFSNVFTEDISFSESFSSMRKEPLNAKVKKALEEGKAINFIVAGWAKEPGPHVMTVWGFDFDEEGCISAVYFVDNNNNSNTYHKQSLKRYQVVFEAPDYNKTIQVMYIHHPVVADPSIKNPKAARKHKVNVLEFFDLRQDIWKQHFPDVKP